MDYTKGRNLLLKTGSLSGWGTNNGTTLSDGVATFPTVTAHTWRETWSMKGLPYAVIRDQVVTMSAKVKAAVGDTCCIGLCLGVSSGASTHVRENYSNKGIKFVGTGDWETVSATITASDDYFAGGSGSDFENGNIAFRTGAVNTYWNGFEAKEFKLEFGTEATDWRPAPEDEDYNSLILEGGWSR